MANYGGWGNNANAFSDGFLKGMAIYNAMRDIAVDSETNAAIDAAEEGRDLTKEKTMNQNAYDAEMDAWTNPDSTASPTKSDFLKKDAKGNYLKDDKGNYISNYERDKFDPTGSSAEKASISSRAADSQVAQALMRGYRKKGQMDKYREAKKEFDVNEASQKWADTFENYMSGDPARQGLAIQAVLPMAEKMYGMKLGFKDGQVFQIGKDGKASPVQVNPQMMLNAFQAAASMDMLRAGGKNPDEVMTRIAQMGQQYEENERSKAIHTKKMQQIDSELAGADLHRKSTANKMLIDLYKLYGANGVKGGAGNGSPASSKYVRKTNAQTGLTQLFKQGDERNAYADIDEQPGMAERKYMPNPGKDRVDEWLSAGMKQNTNAHPVELDIDGQFWNGLKDEKTGKILLYGDTEWRDLPGAASPDESPVGAFNPKALAQAVRFMEKNYGIKFDKSTLSDIEGMLGKGGGELSKALSGKQSGSKGGDQGGKQKGDMSKFVVGGKPTKGMLQPGNIDITEAKPVKNGDKVSTVRSMSINENGKEILIPTVADGKLLTKEQAIARFHKTGKHLGVFDSPDAATEYAKALSADHADKVKGDSIKVDPNNLGAAGKELYKRYTRQAVERQLANKQRVLEELAAESPMLAAMLAKRNK